MEDNVFVMCPDCHEMKMGPKELQDSMMTCDGCGKSMKEMVMR